MRGITYSFINKFSLSLLLFTVACGSTEYSADEMQQNSTNDLSTASLINGVPPLNSPDEIYAKFNLKLSVFSDKNSFVHLSATLDSLNDSYYVAVAIQCELNSFIVNLTPSSVDTRQFVAPPVYIAKGECIGGETFVPTLFSSDGNPVSAAVEFLFKSALTSPTAI